MLAKNSNQQSLRDKGILRAIRKEQENKDYTQDYMADNSLFLKKHIDK
jgi:hypothetical protein